MADPKANPAAAGGNETIDVFTTRLGGIKSQRELGKLLAAEQAEGKRKPFMAAIERRVTELAKATKDARRARRPAAGKGGKRAGGAAPQNSVPIAPGAFGKEDARPLAEAYFDKAGEMQLSVAFGDDKSLIRNLEPVEGVTVIPKNGHLVNSAAVEVNTDGLPGRVEITHAYLLADGKPFGLCELAAPLPLAPNQRAAFPIGHLMFRS